MANSRDDIELEKKHKNVAMAVAGAGAGVAGAATGLTNALAVLSLSSTGGSVMQGVLQAGAAVGGATSAAMNFLFNYDLLTSFYQRITRTGAFHPVTGKKRSSNLKKLPVWKKIARVVGCVLVVATGLMFGAVSFSFSSTGPLAIIGIVAGVAVAAIATIQEMETWLDRFDVEKKFNEDGEEIVEEEQTFIEWMASLNVGKVAGWFLALMNTLALCLTFAIGLATFFMAVGFPAFPSLISAFVLAYTAGAFTQLNFYSKFLGDFCGDIKQRLTNFKDTQWSPLGAVCAFSNAAVNGLLTYAAIGLLTTVVVAAGVAAPPFGVILGVGIAAAVFVGVASLVLGANFWTGTLFSIFPCLKRKVGSLVVIPPPESDGNNPKPSSSGYQSGNDSNNHHPVSRSASPASFSEVSDDEGRSLVDGNHTDVKKTDAALLMKAKELIHELPRPLVGTSSINVFKENAVSASSDAALLKQSKALVQGLPKPPVGTSSKNMFNDNAASSSNMIKDNAQLIKCSA